jgi:hypothetical protein
METSFIDWQVRVLEWLHVLYHSAIRFATNAPYRTHQCTLYSSVNWSSLYIRRKPHWLLLIFKILLGLTPPYLRYLLQPSSPTYNTRSASHILLNVPKAHTSLGHSSFQFAAGSDWNELEKKLCSLFAVTSQTDLAVSLLLIPALRQYLGLWEWCSSEFLFFNYFKVIYKYIQALCSSRNEEN